MTEIQLDPATEEKYFRVTSRVPVRGAGGKVIGHYVPEDEYIKMLYATYKGLSEEEWARREAETGSCTLEDIWKQLGAK